MTFASRICSKTLAFLLVFLVSVQPAVARSVNLDIRNEARAYRGIRKALKPYCIDLRKRIESRWASSDPCTGETATVVMVIDSDGNLADIKPGEGSGTAQGVASEIICQCAPFSPVPQPQPCLLIKATLRSKQPRVDPTPAVNALMCLAVGALIGFSIYELVKSSRNSNSGNNNGVLVDSNGNVISVNFQASGTVNPNYQRVSGYTRKNGTYVPAHRRTRANRNRFDNYSTQGNINPWTGLPGHVNPYGH